MKILKILNFVSLIPIITGIVTILGSWIFGCSGGGSNFDFHCSISIIEPIITFLTLLMLIFSMSAFIWVIPAILISIAVFKGDYDELKLNNGSNKSIFKIASFYILAFYVLVSILIIGVLLFK